MAQAAWKIELKPYAILLAGMESDFDNLMDEELASLRSACDEPTNTNCWWATKQAADLIRPMLDEQIYRRSQQPKPAGDAV